MESPFFLILLVFWIPVWFVRREIAFRHTPGYWRRFGAVVLRPGALQGREESIGSYMGAPIFRRVRFHGCDYDFDRVAPSEERDLIAGGELFLEPGIVYRMRRERPSGVSSSACAQITDGST
ncbi:MAG: hypothetical protein KDH20_08025 [Rhodocyclaceae bacterium]|nr:hypothetical protein [Rhodocyclaceae bacterium]